MSGSAASGQDVVASTEEAARQQQEPLIIIDPLRGFLDDAGLGRGPLSATPIGEGHSNVTFALDRGTDRFVLRRPPRGPLPASTHDMLREARLLRALASAGVRVPEVLAICETPELIGAPFYVMRFINGHVLGPALPETFNGNSDGQLVAEQLVDALVELHAVDISTGELSTFGRPSGYLERQIRRFRELLQRNATRPLPDLETVADWLAANRPKHSENTVVHGDYRVGNVMFAVQGPPRIAALLDWEMATLGDPLADVGYMTATWAEPTDPSDPVLDLSGVTRLPQFPGRQALIDRYANSTGRDLTDLSWYQTLALWKAAIFLEGSYGRYLAGSTHDPFFARLKGGVPLLAGRALSQIRAA